MNVLPFDTCHRLNYEPLFEGFRRLPKLNAKTMCRETSRIADLDTHKILANRQPQPIPDSVAYHSLLKGELVE